ncbi:MAG: 2OG-Fe(II) oxygenase [Colwellia sp.]
MNILEKINIEALCNSAKGFNEKMPFPYAVVDDFFDTDLALQLEQEFPDYTSSLWHKYDNAIEVKKTLNNWNVFPPLTYSVFDALNSEKFLNLIQELFGVKKLYSDQGLNGGGWHIHRAGGKLNTHLDYSIHPKLGLQRKLNLLVYLNSNWENSWGGDLGLWNGTDKAPSQLITEIAPIFNRAVIFDTTQNSWHGLPAEILSPDTEYRRSLATYYLQVPEESVSLRGKALFAPYKAQVDDKSVLELIRKRADVKTANSVYKK